MADSQHAHRCKYGPGYCPGTCACVCGAQLAKGPTFSTDSLWQWRLPDGTWAQFPDEHEHLGVVQGAEAEGALSLDKQ